MSRTNDLKISIVTPVYNGGSVIRDLIESVLDQDYSHWEMIIQDGESTDSTLQVVSDFQDNRIKVYTEKDNGMYDALNKAINKASGDYIIHLNSDEQLMEGALCKIVNQIYQKPKFDTYCFGVIIIDRQRKPKVYRAAYPQNSLFIKLFNLDIFTAGIVYKASVFNKIKFSTNHKAVSDALLFIDLVKNFKVYYSSVYTSFFLVEGTNLSLDEVAIEERNELKNSVLFGNLSYYFFYIPRKLYKVFKGCRNYSGPRGFVRIFSEGNKIKRSTVNISYKLEWDNLTNS